MNDVKRARDVAVAVRGCATRALKYVSKPSPDWDDYVRELQNAEYLIQSVCYDGSSNSPYVKRRICHRIPGRMKYGRRMPKCSECGYSLGDMRWKHCPSCGAQIVEN